MALGAVKIPVLPVLEPVKELKESSVFLIPLIGVAGHDPADGPDHQAVGKGQKNQIERELSHKGGQQACNESCSQNHHAQPVCTVASVHKPPESLAHIIESAAKPASESIHIVTHPNVQC